MKKYTSVLILFLSLSGYLFAASSTNCNEHYIGEHFGGGVIFYLDNTCKHGLISALNDSEFDGMTDFIWGVVSAWAPYDGMGAGTTNTQNIIQANDNVITAAYVASLTNDGGFNDWYLPSRFELKLLHDHRNIIPNFSTNNNCNYNGDVGILYWSSSMDYSSYPFSRLFPNGEEPNVSISTIGHVRAIRHF